MIVTDKRYYMHSTLKDNLDILKEYIRKDWYFIILVTGSNRVRIGKTTLAEQIAYYLDPKFDFSNVTFNPAKVREISLKKNKYEVVFYDEAKAGLDAKKAMENMQKSLLDFLAAAGQLNQFLIIVLPDYFELKKEIATNQSICLVNCYTKKGNFFDRGNFQFFNIEKKNKLYYWGKKQGGYYWAVSPDFTGDFNEFQILNKDKYSELKHKFLLDNKKEDPKDDIIKRLENKINKQSEDIKKIREARDRVLFLAKKAGATQKEILKATGLSFSATNKINQMVSWLPKHKI